MKLVISKIICKQIGKRLKNTSKNVGFIKSLFSTLHDLKKIKQINVDEGALFLIWLLFRY